MPFGLLVTFSNYSSAAHLDLMASSSHLRTFLLFEENMRHFVLENQKACGHSTF